MSELDSEPLARTLWGSSSSSTHAAGLPAFEVRALPATSARTTHATASRTDGFQAEQLIDYDLCALVEGFGFGDLIFSRAGMLHLNDGTLLNRVLIALLGACLTAAACLVFLLRSWEESRVLRDDFPVLAEKLTVTSIFLLSTFIALHVSRWLGHRANLTTMQSCAANVVTACVAHGADKEDVLQLIRWFVAAQWLIFREADRVPFGRAVDAPGTDEEATCFLTRDELNSLLQVRFQAQAVCHWAASFLPMVRTKYELHAPSVARLEGQCASAAAALQSIQTRLTTKVPFVYAQLITIIIDVHMAVVSITAGTRLAEALRAVSKASSLSHAARELLELLPTIMWLLTGPVVFYGLLLVSHHIENPFGPRPLSFHREYHSGKFSRMLHGFCEVGLCC